MNTVGSVIKRKNMAPVTVAPGTPILQALQIMADKNIGSVVVTKEEQYLGIITERDYSRKVALNGKNSSATMVEEIMSTDLPSVTLTDSIEKCMQLMTEKNIRYMPVFENDKLVGLISMSDLVKQTILQQEETIQALESYIRS